MATKIETREVSEEDFHVTHHEFSSVEEAEAFLDSVGERRVWPATGRAYWVENDIRYGAQYWRVA